ncbi:alpha/beta fold hydrolase [Glycomyces xiaoerkulensis]|uniref:alpha/beta fold hydrolase n=1 Tax=Glycomyces xiaoerkulensis TaxID=2038139 RepID=UPI000C2624CD|nr:alpha/beta fold hydrolase [Glycomyces xiaoerkulensis]
MPHATVEDIRLCYEETGDGPAVVFVHGGLADRRMWDDQFAALADHRTVRYDARGHGESDTGEGPFSGHRDLLALMDALSVERAVLVGNSIGGGHAVEAALAAPDRVAGMVLVSAGLVGYEWPPTFVQEAQSRVHGTVPAERMAVYRQGDGADVPELDHDLDVFAGAHIRWMIAGPARTEDDLPAGVWERAVAMFRARLRRMWTEDSPQETAPDVPAQERLREVEAPTLVVNGLEDVPEIQAVSDLLSREDTGIPGARRVDLPDTGHCAPLERPEEFTGLLRSFLAEQATG